MLGNPSFPHKHYAGLGMNPQSITKSLHPVFDRLLAIAHQYCDLRSRSYNSSMAVDAMQLDRSINTWHGVINFLIPSACVARCVERQHLEWCGKLPSSDNTWDTLYRKSASNYTTKNSNPHAQHALYNHTGSVSETCTTTNSTTQSIYIQRL